MLCFLLLLLPNIVLYFCISIHTLFYYQCFGFTDLSSPFHHFDSSGNINCTLFIDVCFSHSSVLLSLFPAFSLLSVSLLSVLHAPPLFFLNPITTIFPLPSLFLIILFSLFTSILFFSYFISMCPVFCLFLPLFCFFSFFSFFTHSVKWPSSVPICFLHLWHACSFCYCVRYLFYFYCVSSESTYF